MSLRKFLATHHRRISITDVYQPYRKGKHDDTIMNCNILTRYTTQQQSDINCVRIHLQAFRLSDLQDRHDRTSICEVCLSGKRPPHFELQSAWPNQPYVTNQQRRLWRRYITSTYLRYGNKWRQSPIDSKPASQPIPPISHNNLSTYLSSLDKWFQRLLSQYTQIATDTQIWNAFRSKRWIDIASDGGLNEQTGTFGWKIFDTKRDMELFTGAGPIDGPIKMNSATRSELARGICSTSIVDHANFQVLGSSPQV